MQDGIIKYYLNKCQFLQRTSNYISFTIQVYPLGFIVKIDIFDKDLYTHKYNFEFKKIDKESDIEKEYKTLLNILEKYRNKKEYKSPQCITKDEIRYKFLNCPKAIQIMKKYNIYDERKSLSANSVFFLNAMEGQNKLSDLWKDLK